MLAAVPFRESNFVVFMAENPTALAESVLGAGRVWPATCGKTPGVISVAQQIGRADPSEDTWGPNISEIWVVIDEHASYDQLLDQHPEPPGTSFRSNSCENEWMKCSWVAVTS